MHRCFCQLVFLCRKRGRWCYLRSWCYIVVQVISSFGALGPPPLFFLPAVNNVIDVGVVLVGVASWLPLPLALAAAVAFADPVAFTSLAFLSLLCFSACDMFFCPRQRSGAEMSTQTLATSYALAIGTACPLAFGLGKVRYIPSTHRELPIIALVVILTTCTLGT